MTNHTFSEKEANEFLRSGFIFGLNHGRFAIGWGELKKSQMPEGACSVYAPDFYIEDKSPWLIPANFALVDREFFATHVLPKMTTEVKDFRWQEPSETSFLEQFNKIQKAFKNEGLEKAVPVVHALAAEPPTSAQLPFLLKALIKLPESLTAYGFWRFDERGGEGLIGATPEALFTREGETVSTMALAGTRKKESDGSGGAALLADPKERHEHQLVIDDIQAVLSKFGAVQVGQTFAAELPTLFHLKTPISLKLSSAMSASLESTSSIEFEELARALHPTPALGLSPRAKGISVLKQWDDVSLRGRFGAPFGILMKTAEDDVQCCLVAIRNVQWRGSSFQLGSGCGIVPESQFEREWSELKLKRDSVKKVLGLQ